MAGGEYGGGGRGQLSLAVCTLTSHPGNASDWHPRTGTPSEPWIVVLCPPPPHSSSHMDISSSPPLAPIPQMGMGKTAVMISLMLMPPPPSWADTLKVRGGGGAQALSRCRGVCGGGELRGGDPFGCSLWYSQQSHTLNTTSLQTIHVFVPPEPRTLNPEP